MCKWNFFFLLASLLCFGATAQTIVQRDPAIAGMVSQVNGDSMKVYIEKMISFGTRHTMSSVTDPQRGIGAARNWVATKFNEWAKQSSGRMTAFVDTTTLPPDGRRIAEATHIGNAMAILKGTDPNDKRIFIISGHLDSRVSDVMNKTADAPGANDDASGVAAVMECARIMSKSLFSATIIFVAVSGEEQGLLGAQFMAKKAKAEGWQIEAVLNNDIMGSNNSHDTKVIDNTKVRVFSEGLPAFETEKSATQLRNLGMENDGKARQLARYVKEVGERYVDQLEVKLIYRNDRFLRGGDHTSFIQQGFAAVRITEMNENFNRQHQDLRTEKGVEYGDKIEFIDFEYLRKNTALNLACLANLAKAPSMPQEAKVETRGLTNFTQITWKASANGKPKGYYILMRETSSAMWEKKFFIEGLEAKLPYSKDNYFFAVQAVNAEGNESLPVVPIPGR